MRTDVLDIADFYATDLGNIAAQHLGTRLTEAWGDAKDLSIAGFGYTGPYLQAFPQARRCINLAPEAMGVTRPNQGAQSRTAITRDTQWPLPDASIDRIFIVHGLEETNTPHKLMREVWRVLADDGKLIIAVPNRRGPWAMFETTPFAAGRPYLRGQLDRLLRQAMFTPAAWSSALFFPPLNQRYLLRAAKAWERAGSQFWSGFAGITLVEARKELAFPASGSKVEVLSPRVLSPRPYKQTGPRLKDKTPYRGQEDAA